MAKPKTPKVLEGEIVSSAEIVPCSDLQKQTPAIVKKAQAIIVANAEQYSLAGELLLDIKDLEKRIIGRFEEPKQKAHEAHKAITALEKELLLGPRTAKAVIEEKLAGWRDEQERARKLEQKKLQEAMEAQAEKDRASEIKALQKAGKAKEAKALAKEEIIVDVPTVVSEVPKVDGLSVRKQWKFEVTDDTLVPREYLMPDDGKIAKVVRALQGNTSIPGVRVWEESITVGR